MEIGHVVGDTARPALEILQRVPLERLDEAIGFLRAHKSAAEVCRALTTFIATAPLADFELLRAVYRKHCAGHA